MVKLALMLSTLILGTQSVIVDLHGNLVGSNAKYPSSSCCILPSCNRPGECYQMVSCGYLCGTGRYPPADGNQHTPGYHLRDSYLSNECRFGECKTFWVTCSHCKDPTNSDFNIHIIRDDCLNCYDHA